MHCLHIEVTFKCIRAI